MNNTRRHAAKEIDNWQIKKLHTLYSALGLAEEEYRLTLFMHVAKDSTKDLTFAEAEKLIGILEEVAVERGVWVKYPGKAAFEQLGCRPGMATPSQLRNIEALWKDASRIRSNDDRAAALRSWLFKFFKISDLRFLPADQVSKVLKALRAMKGRRAVKDGRAD